MAYNVQAAAASLAAQQAVNAASLKTAAAAKAGSAKVATPAAGASKTTGTSSVSIPKPTQSAAPAAAAATVTGTVQGVSSAALNGGTALAALAQVLQADTPAALGVGTPNIAQSASDAQAAREQNAQGTNYASFAPVAVPPAQVQQTIFISGWKPSQ